MEARNRYCTIVLSNKKDANSLNERVLAQATKSLAAFGIKKILRITRKNATVFTTCPKSWISYEGKACIILHGISAISKTGTLINSDILLNNFVRSGASCFDDIETPFLAFAIENDKITISNDAYGIVHLYYHEDENMVAASSSASILARIFKLPYDTDGIFQQLIIGHRLNNKTAFRDVSLIPRDALVNIGCGEIIFLNRESSSIEQLTNNSLETGYQAISDSVSRCLNAKPDCGIELSGGFDSRMLLSTIPRELRKDRTAYTIGFPNTPDVDIAKRLSTECNLKFNFIDLSKYVSEEPEILWNRVKRVAYRDDFSTNTVDRLAIDCVDDEIRENPRMSGVNGELARGFYYPFMDIKGNSNTRNIDKLIRWRLITNDAAPQQLFDKEKFQQSMISLRESVALSFVDTSQSFGQALDKFYLSQRMCHWAGLGFSAAIANRIILTPFFHTDYVNWALRVPPTTKCDSYIFSQLLKKMDPTLALMPLDSNIVPALLARGGVISKFAILNTRVSKISHKIKQVLRKTPKASLGSVNFQTKLQEQIYSTDFNWSHIYDIGIFSEQYFDKLICRKVPFSRPILGNFISLNFLAIYLQDSNKSNNVSIEEFAKL